MASAIASMVAACVAALVVYTGRSFAGMANYVSLDRKSRNALDVMSQQIRQANILTDYSTNSLTFQDSDGGVLKYAYDPSARTLTRYKNNVADAKALLTECDYLRFDIYQNDATLVLRFTSAIRWRARTAFIRRRHLPPVSWCK